MLSLLLTIACSTTPTPDALPLPPTVEPAPVLGEAFPTPTPFQPMDAPNPYLAPPTSQPAPTFTPYPTQYVQPQGMSVPVEIVPSVENTASITNPLTGLLASDPTFLERRPIAIKVGNSPDYVRPQSGLTLADVVYEYYIEWGDTRFIAVFYGNHPERVGPVRSGRYFDEHITRMYHAFFFFKGADKREMDYFRSLDISDFMIITGFGNCPPFFVGPYKRDAYNNVFFDLTRWAACAARRGLDNSPQEIKGGFFSEEAPPSALSISRIYSYYSVYNYNFWEYDPAQGLYVRYQESQDMVDGKAEAYAPLRDDLTKLPVTASNVVVLFAPHVFINNNQAEDEIYRIDLIDYGNAYVFRDGVAVPARWVRPERDQPFMLTTLDGDPLYLKPGQTFYQVMGATSSYQLNGSEWRFVFQTP